MNVVDTNIWIYCHDSRDSQKQRIASRIVETVEPMALLWQVGCEFIAASRKLEPFGFTQSHAWAALEDMQAMADAVLMPNSDLWPQCQAIHSQYGFHFWDALILAACVHHRVQTLYSEDIPENDNFHGVRIVNPFR